MFKPTANTSALLLLCFTAWSCVSPLLVVCTCEHGQAAVVAASPKGHSCDGDGSHHHHSHAPGDDAPPSQPQQPQHPDPGCTDSPLSIAQVTASSAPFAPATVLDSVQCAFTAITLPHLSSRSVFALILDAGPPEQIRRAVASSVRLI